MFGSNRRALLKRALVCVALPVACFSYLGCAVYGPGLLGADGATLRDGDPVTSDSSGGSDVASPGGAGGRGGAPAEVAGSGGSPVSQAGMGTNGGADPGSTGGSDAGGASSAGNAGTDTTGGSDTSGGNAAMAGSANGGSAAQAGAAGSGGDGAGGGAGATVIELARGKHAKASSEQLGHEAKFGNDGDSTTRWCARNGTFPQWWRVDLGGVHSLHGFSIKFEHPQSEYAYQVETSDDDAVYTLQANQSGGGVTQSVAFTRSVFARYVRVTITNGTPYPDANGNPRPSWACFLEFTVKGE